MFKLLPYKENTGEGSRARRGQYVTAHGAVETPVFMNVATQAAIKGGLSSGDLHNIGCQVALANTYHLHIRPGDELIRSQGGLHKFMAWDGPFLTDSGGFQIFSLARLRKISDDGVSFRSHIDGRKIFMTPESSIQIQQNLGSDIMMAFDECVAIPSPRSYVEESCERTFKWLVRSKASFARLAAFARLEQSGAEENRHCGHGSGRRRIDPQPLTGSSRPQPSLFGINQGAVYKDLRIEHMKRIAELDLPGYAIGGLAVGETAQEMYGIIDAVEEHMPRNKPRYLMGVGTPQNIVECVARGIDFFDCVMPARNGRHGRFYIYDGSSINIKNEKYKDDSGPVDERCGCPVCAAYSRSYIRHLFMSGEILGLRFAVMHNLYFYNTLMSRIRSAIEEGTFNELHRQITGAGNARPPAGSKEKML